MEYSFYGVFLCEDFSGARVVRDMTKAVTELLAGNAAKQRSDLHRNEPVSNRAKNKKPLKEKCRLRERLSPLFR